MTVVSMSSVTTGTTRRRRGEARRGVARAARGAAERGGDAFDAVTTRETRANASVDGMKDARALAPTRGVGRERVVDHPETVEQLEPLLRCLTYAEVRKSIGILANLWVWVNCAAVVAGSAAAGRPPTTTPYALRFGTVDAFGA